MTHSVEFDFKTIPADTHENVCGQIRYSPLKQLVSRRSVAGKWRGKTGKAVGYLVAVPFLANFTHVSAHLSRFKKLSAKRSSLSDAGYVPLNDGFTSAGSITRVHSCFFRLRDFFFFFASPRKTPKAISCPGFARVRRNSNIRCCRRRMTALTRSACDKQKYLSKIDVSR